MAEKSVVTVKIKRQEGWYIATSQDLDGFIVCHKSWTKLAQEVPLCIQALYQANHGVEVDVEEIPSLDSHDMSRVVFEAKKKAA